LDIHNKTELKSLRKGLRKNLTPAEAKLWKFLQNSQLEGRKFRRQHSIGRYIIDFYCPKEKLAIELDGNGHSNPINQQYDLLRSGYLNTLNIKVIRFENKDIFEKVETVLEIIKSNFSELPPLAPPKQGGEFSPVV
jgi:very-short-patch-repair endonuclease